MTTIRTNLLDGQERPARVVTVEADRRYEVNDYFKSPDGGLYLIAAVKDGESPIDVELTALWIDGERLGRRDALGLDRRRRMWDVCGSRRTPGPSRAG